MARPFCFGDSYLLAASRGPVLAALRDADRWPLWWPQIRSVDRQDAQTGLAVVRSRLPITLRLKLIGEIDDPEAGLLRAQIEGDLEGWIQLRVTAGATPRTSQVSYTQECTVTKPGLARASTRFRPLLNANHAAMMRAGMRGLATYAS